MKKLILLISILVLTGILSGCQPVSKLAFNPPPLQLTIEQVSPEETPGQYALFGQTSLRDGTEFVVSAVRPLTSAEPNVSLSEENLYGILARTTAIAENGRWQAQLQLWQISSNNRYQESWQMQDPLASLPLAPDPEVAFAVTLSPSAFALNQQKISQDLNSLGKSPLFNVTPAGEPSLEARKNVTIPLPNPFLAVTNAASATEALLWEGRSASDQTATTFEGEQPLPFAEDDNLPMTASQMLQ